MNLIIDKLPTKVKGMQINTDFRISILFELLMQDIKVKKEIKIIQALKLYYPDFENISNYNEAVSQMLWFYRCGKEIETEETNKFIAMNLTTNIYIVHLCNNII